MIKKQGLQMKFQRFLKEDDFGYFQYLQEKFEDQSQMNDYQQMKQQKNQIKFLNEKYAQKYLTPNKQTKINQIRSISYNQTQLTQRLEKLQLKTQNDQILNIIQSGLKEQKQLSNRFNQRPHTMNFQNKQNDQQKKFYQTERPNAIKRMEQKLQYHDNNKFKQLTLKNQSPNKNIANQVKIKVISKYKDRNKQNSQNTNQQYQKDLDKFKKQTDQFFDDQIQKVNNIHGEISQRKYVDQEFKKVDCQISKYQYKKIQDDSYILEQYSEKAEQSLKIFDNKFFSNKDQNKDEKQQQFKIRKQLRFLTVKPQLKAILEKIVLIGKISKQTNIPFQEVYQQIIQNEGPFQDEKSSQFFQFIIQRNLSKIEDYLNQNRFFLFQYDYFHLTPLHMSAKIGDFNITLHLLNMGAVVEAQDIIGRTPLFFAIKYGHFEIVVLMLIYEALVQFKYYSLGAIKIMIINYIMKKIMNQNIFCLNAKEQLFFIQYQIQKKITQNQQLKSHMKQEMISRLLEKLDKVRRQQIQRFLKTKNF